MVKPIRLYPNESVKRIIAFIPPGHIHLRLIIELEDQIIILHEATVAAIVRAYSLVVLHPQRRAVELVYRRLEKDSRKPFYSEHQLVESGKEENHVIKEAIEILKESKAIGQRG